VRVTCAGRTDTGVHATAQVVHFDSDASRTERAWVYGANSNLPKTVAILWAKPVPETFHARFSAVRRRYRYVIFNRQLRPTFLADRVTWEYRPLDERRMAHAAQFLVGEHDFSSFRSYACQAKSPVRVLHRFDVRREGPFVFLEVEANGFLHHMIRNMAGVLASIGAGEQAPEWAREVLDHRDRVQGGVTAPSHGLYFTGVAYPAEFGLPDISPAAVVW
jgi:tRNA pseudouridine38-40 synthase